VNELVSFPVAFFVFCCARRNPFSDFFLYDSYLVDPASSHMLVSKIKPCMSKYKHVLYCETADGSLYQL